MPVQSWAKQYCSSSKGNCQNARCCSEEGMQCYSKGQVTGPVQVLLHARPRLDRRRRGELELRRDRATRARDCLGAECREPGGASMGLGAVLGQWRKLQLDKVWQSGWPPVLFQEPGLEFLQAGLRVWAPAGGPCGRELVLPRPGAQGARPGGDASREAGVFPGCRWPGSWRGRARQLDEMQAWRREGDGRQDERAGGGWVKFVVNVGDSFQDNGVLGRGDEKRGKAWRWIHSERLRSVPWHSVYGDRDCRSGPCACVDVEAKCAQVNYDEQNLEYFQMPGTSNFRAFPDMAIEIVGLDPWERARGSGLRGVRAERLRRQVRPRHRESHPGGTGPLLHPRRGVHGQVARGLLPLPDGYFVGPPDFLGALSDNSRRDITYFGGHRRGVDDAGAVSIEPNKYWVVGEGGDESCDADRQQGFVVGEIAGDSSIATYTVFMDGRRCSS
ncbi:unnamed protein product [Prorocentrum cordatum]|uniref:Subtilisin n=1 Tax=Prorocentrum cordatum TaxID=2364126 RepID=A0ABN9YIK5_9DINO|nr:unnamed protein product [Polarella glacialis]